jgi:hypothetical protein
MARRVYKGQRTSSTGTEVLRDGTLAVDLDNNTVYIHDGATAGGILVPLPTVKTVNFIQSGGGTVTFDTVSTSLGKVFEFTFYHVGSDVTQYPTISTSTEISYYKVTLIHDGTNVTTAGTAVVANTGTSTLANTWEFTLAGGLISLKTQSNTTYNTIKIIRTVY